MQKTLIFIAGCFIGGLIGGVTGYVINDLTDRDNPEVMQEIEAEQAQQDEFEDFLDQLAATPPPTATAAATPEPPVDPSSAGSGASDNSE
ncbi:MAG: hypothetical protein ACJAYU_003947 [Bradymonadia bacterium]|jgi:hypothetical protein